MFKFNYIWCYEGGFWTWFKDKFKIYKVTASDEDGETWIVKETSIILIDRERW